jgi:hypothetical protein
MSGETMAASEYVTNTIWDELDRSVNEALERKYMRKQFNWTQANPVYRG